MPKTQLLSEPVNTKRLLKNLSMAIDEIKLMREIESLAKQLKSIESKPHQTYRKFFIEKQIAIHKDQLSVIRAQEL